MVRKSSESRETKFVGKMVHVYKETAGVGTTAKSSILSNDDSVSSTMILSSNKKSSFVSKVEHSTTAKSIDKTENNVKQLQHNTDDDDDGQSSQLLVSFKDDVRLDQACIVKQIELEDNGESENMNNNRLIGCISNKHSTDDITAATSTGSDFDTAHNGGNELSNHNGCVEEAASGTGKILSCFGCLQNWESA